MDQFTHITVWVLASVCTSLIAGFYIGRAMRPEQKHASASERKAALKTLLDLLQAVERLTSDVGDRATEMREVGRHVGDLEVTGELEEVRQVLLQQVGKVLESNMKLEDDLQFARCRMEEQAEELDRTRREAHTDPVSGVFNRKAFDDKLLLLIGMFKREGDPFTLILLDVDHFKWINDTHGHQSGDNVIGQLGVTLSKSLREIDFVARYGGDEFVVLLPHADLETGRQIAQRLHTAVNRGNFGLSRKGDEAAVTVSMGAATVQSHDTPQTIFERVDRALYESKSRGRNKLTFISNDQVASEGPALEAPDAALTT